MSIPKRKKNLLDEVPDVMRLHHYSIHRERTYCDWIKRYIQLMNGEAKSESFLTHLAWDKDVSPSTQNQVMKVLVFLYKQVLKKPLGEEINAVRAIRKPNVLVVMTREEVARVITLMEGTPQLIVKLLYGSGLRIIGALRLLFQNHLSRVRMIYEHDLMNGYGEVYLPDVLSRKYPNAAKEWNWH